MDRHSLHMIWRSTGLKWSTWMQQDMIRICSSNSVPQAIPSPLFARFPIPTKFTALSHVWDYLQAHFRISRMTCGLVSAEFRVRALRCPCWMRQCGICHYFFSKSWWNCWFKSIFTISSQVFFFGGYRTLWHSGWLDFTSSYLHWKSIKGLVSFKAPELVVEPTQKHGSFFGIILTGSINILGMTLVRGSRWTDQTFYFL